MLIPYYYNILIYLGYRFFEKYKIIKFYLLLWLRESDGNGGWVNVIQQPILLPGINIGPPMSLADTSIILLPCTGLKNLK